MRLWKQPRLLGAGGAVGAAAAAILAATVASSCGSAEPIHTPPGYDGGAGAGGTGGGLPPDGGLDRAGDLAGGGGAGGGGDASVDQGTEGGGNTTLLADGKSCAANADCQSGFCTDGVCCHTACKEACYTCASQGSLGTCMPAEVGTDPREECADQGVSSCGTDGVCNGAGACRKYPAGVICKDPSCSGSTMTLAFRCDGAGLCTPTAGQPCDPYVCGTGSCKTTCTADADCTSPNSCNNGSCGKRPLGGKCASPDDCNSGICQQGACCSTTCSGTCKSCAVPGSEGSCTDVPAGQDPLGQCADSGASTCNTDGTCDGKGGCRLYVSGTVCIAPTCSGSTATLAGRCDGAGTCTAGTQQQCDPYKCGASGQCGTSCASSNDCTTGNVCNGTICGKKVNGVDCTTASECASGFCQQGVCCAGACTGICTSCALAGTKGVCTPAAAGQDPLNQCADAGPASCGTDGSCNGAGACRLYAPGFACASPTCSGSTATLAGRCDGVGNCGAGATQSCAPYVCGGSSCLATCSTGSDCTAGNVCTASSCGLKSLGSACGAASECASNFCEQGVCCQTACRGTCMSCSLTGTGGTCSTVPAGQDPLNQCADQGAASCGTDGSCNGVGGCRLYASGTQCAAPTCTGSTSTPPRTCNGAGVCAAATSISCGAYNCGASGTCLTTCTTNADCVSPNVCNGGVCSKKPLGAVCTTAAECDSGLCQQGVCCSSSCTGTCRSCALSGSAGTCTLVPVGQDPLGQCTDNGASSCGTDGTCDGVGGCRLYGAGTVCAGATCSGTTFTPARTCNGTGTCAAATTATCDPYVCGTSACKTSCTTNADCTSPNTCITGSCGKKPIGAACGAAAECNSGFCAQGFCCATACTGTCQSCALTGSVGTCSAVPAGQDPLNQCADQGATSCGTDGFCDGSGGCRLYANGTTCGASTCVGTTFTPARTCDGAGVCRTSTATNCGAYVCGSGGVCLTSCGTTADCVSPNVCNGTTCSKKPNGAMCAAATECASGFCEQGSCCISACTGSCRSCSLSGTAGTCTLVGAGQDPLGQCSDQGAASCGTDGTCDGGGGCRLYASGTACVAASCTGSTFTSARTCNGTGTCQTSTSTSCGNYVCGSNVCLTSCTADADCTAPNVCVAGACTKKPAGSTCAAGSDCLSGFCQQGVCCQTACTGTCQSCALAGSSGTCTNVAAGQDPLNQCSDQGASTCGTDGFCNGSGACRLYATGTTCVAATCSGSTFTPARTCNGTGTCQTVTSSGCSPYVCGTGACKTTCTADADCVSPFSCNGGSCTTKGAGAACTTASQCTSGFCAQGFCCNAACTGTCQSCALTGTVGTCTNVPAGQDPLNQCTDNGAAACGTDGFCNGSGACRLYASGTTCVAATCTGSTFTPLRTCNGSGTCQTATSSACDPFACGTGACKTTCTVDTDCASPFTCNGGTCTKKAQGAACTTATQCLSGFCAQGFCCNAACTGTCQSCALTGTVGACTNVPTGQDPLNQCTDNGAAACGTDGFCNGSGACRLYASGTQCAAASCTGVTLTSARTCNGTGTCQAATTSSCDPFACGTGACKTTCSTNADCNTPNVCNAGSCGKKSIGTSCAAGTECASGFCAQGFCCNAACAGTCQSCALTGTVGTCMNVPAGQDPLNQCTDNGAAACGTDGFCNGSGACRLYASGTTCVAASCTGSTLTPARTCNGTGTCQTVTTSPCDPFVCGTGACKTTCTADTDCVSPFTCNGGSCTKKAMGAACTTASQCTSGFCAQGFCCNAACTGTCLSCALSGTVGTCTNVPAGQDPLSQCTDNGATACGTDGACNGSGACRLYAAGTQCAAASCTGATLTSARTCNGTGTCQTASTSGCDPYLCGTNACKTSCTTSADCNTPNVCSGGVCTKKTNGTSCSAGTECTSGVCAQGVCCATACSSNCKSCALSGSMGTCSNVPAGQDPLNQCTDAGAASCMTDGFCDGSGGCRMYAAGTQCAAASCSVATASSARTCNGAGTCQSATTTPCTPYVCGTNACKTSCSTSTDCSSPNVCTGTTCGAPSSLKVQYATGDTNGTDNQVRPHFQIINTGTTAVALSTLTIRYWYTIDGVVAQTAWCDFATLGCSNIVESFVTVSPARTNADTYLLVGFASGAGNLAANGGSTGEVQARFNKNDFTNYTESNDYSYDVTKTSYTDWIKVTLYQNGTLVWGTEP